MITCKQVTKCFGGVTALSPFDLNLTKGEFVVIKGASGSGKTTLLLALGGMLRPTEGEIKYKGDNLYELSPSELGNYRSNEIGFVFQMFHLVPYLNVEENVQLAIPNDNQRNQSHRLLDQLGLSRRLTHTPSELSAGERQRVALARALVNQPEIIMADEPTGNLDPENDRQVFKHLSEYHKKGGTVIVVTHGSTADEFADRIVNLKAGQ